MRRNTINRIVRTVRTKPLSDNKFKFISLGLSCLLAMSETMGLDNTIKSNGIVHAIKILKNDIKELN